MSTTTPDTRIEWALLADYALVDTSGKLSLIGVFNRLRAPAFPSLQPVIFFASSMQGIANRAITSELRVWSPSKELLVGGQQQAQLGQDGRANGIYRLSPLPLTNPGTYIFELLLDGASAVHVPLDVEQVTSQ